LTAKATSEREISPKTDHAMMQRVKEYCEMERISRLILTSVLALLILSSACNLPAQSLPTPPGQFTATPSPITILSSTQTSTAFIPVTGVDVVSLQCQFCVNDETHAVLIISKLTSFNVSDPVSGVTCLMAKDVGDRRIVLCRGAPQASFNLNVCVDAANCLQFPITLQTCPLIPATGAGTAPVVPTFAPLTPVILTPQNAQDPSPGDTSTIVPSTPVPTNAGVTSTVAPSTAVPTNTGVIPPLPTSATVPPPLPTSTAQPSTAEPPEEPTATSSGTGGGGGEGDSLVICHISPGNPDQQRTMTVSQSDWQNEHSQHGDSRGAC
jgi:hypothetical protein